MLIWAVLGVLLVLLCWPQRRSMHHQAGSAGLTRRVLQRPATVAPVSDVAVAEPAFSDLLERVVTLLTAGIVGHRAWELVVADYLPADQRDSALAQFADALHHDPDLTGALARYQAALPQPDPLVSVTAIAWRLAEQLGAPLAQVLTRVTDAAHLAHQADAARQEALAGPQATLKLLAGLPLVGYFLAYALGANPFGVLFGSGLGWLLLIVGGVFIAGTCWGVRWLTKTARTSAESPLSPAALIPDLISAALHSGAATDHTISTLTQALDPWPSWLPVQQALTQVNQHRQWGATWAELPVQLDLPPSVADCCRTFALAERTGAPAAELLAAAAGRRRRDNAHRAQVAANQLSVRLVIPLGLGGLPAFFALVLIPTVVDLVGSTLAG